MDDTNVISPERDAPLAVTDRMRDAGGKILEESGLMPFGTEGACGERAIAEEIYRVMRALESMP